MEQMDFKSTSNELDLWFGLSDPTFMLIILGAYLFFVLKTGPEYMKNKPAYKLKAFITVYNVVQVLACIYVVQECLRVTSTKIFRFWQCSMFNQNTRSEYLYNRLVYFAFWLKIVELVETVVFVLRKKQSQVSFLHVFHHSSAVTLVYLLNRYYRSGSALYALFLNSIIHIVMYSYYFAAAVCNQNIAKKLLPIKRSITAIQMIQFCLILLQVAAMWINCELPRILVMYYFAVICVIFYGFYNFYKKSYIQKRL